MGNWYTNIYCMLVGSLRFIESMSPIRSFVHWQQFLLKLTNKKWVLNVASVKLMYGAMHRVLVVAGLILRAFGIKKKWIVLLAELVEEDLGIDRAFPRLFHALEEVKHGCSQRIWTGQRYHQWTLLKQITCISELDFKTQTRAYLLLAIKLFKKSEWESFVNLHCHLLPVKKQFSWVFFQRFQFYFLKHVWALKWVNEVPKISSALNDFFLIKHHLFDKCNKYDGDNPCLNDTFKRKV